jgi:TPR repeat protein
VGNKAYKQTSAVDFAHNDAEAMRSYLIGTLRFREQNVFLLKDATLGELTQMFGTEANPQGGQLWRRAIEGRSNIFVYYSGHGVPDLATREPFLLPQDGNPNSSESGYALQTLYRNLELVRQKIGPQRQLIVMIDACFTGETGRKGESLLAVSAPGFTPAKPRTGSGIVKLVATSGATPANWDQGAKLGLFTSRFLMGAAGLAQPGEVKAVSLADLKRYVTQAVAVAALQDSGRNQLPEIDEASFVLPVGPPVPAIAGMVAAAQDEQAWRKAKASGERLAFEDYIATCTAICRYREEALIHLRGLERTGQAAADRQNWQRLSVAGDYADYLKGCGPVCAYRALAEDYLKRSSGEKDQLIRKCDELTTNPDDHDRSSNAVAVAFKDINAEEAIAVCSAAVEAQPQLRRLSFQLGRAYDKAKRYREALLAYRRAADAGSSIAMNNLGNLLEDGEGGPKNLVEARGWYEKSALAGNAAGMNSIALMFDKGRAGPKDQPQARHWFERAARGGNSEAMNNLGIMMEGGEGGPRNLSEARIWFEKAAQAGVASAMNSFGYMLDNGRGGPVDQTEARRWFEKAALAGDADAMNNLGNSLEHGRGGSRNLAEARRWYEKAAQAGDASAKNNLRRLQLKPKTGP